jgi:hypothetical protein
MTTATDQENPIPSWLNLDAVVPAALRERLSDAADSIDGCLSTLSAICEEAYAATVAYETATSAGGVTADDLFEVVDEVSGAGRLYRALSRAETLIRCGHGDPPSDPDALPAWYRE